MVGFVLRPGAPLLILRHRCLNYNTCVENIDAGILNDGRRNLTQEKAAPLHGSHFRNEAAVIFR
jgi:hypothetical protein